MKVLTTVGMQRIAEIQNKYKFQNTFELETHDILGFCQDIKKAYYLGLNLDVEDLEFIEMVLEKLCE